MTCTFRAILLSVQLLVAAFCIIGATAVFGQTPDGAPQDRFWVTDDAGILSLSTIKQLTDNAKSFEDETTDQVVVVTVNTLAGWAIERYGLWLGNSWGIGQDGKDNGVLLLVAPNDRRVRIDVGRGLESVLTNTIAQSIIDNEILPKFREDDLEGGIIAGHTAIIQALGGKYKEPTNWESFLFLLLLPFFAIGRYFGFSGSFLGGGGLFGGGGASGSW